MDPRQGAFDAEITEVPCSHPPSFYGVNLESCGARGKSLGRKMLTGNDTGGDAYYDAESEL